MKKLRIALTVIIAFAIPLVVSASGTPIDTISVDSETVSPVYSNEILASDHVYLLEASGTYKFGNPNRIADAECYQDTSTDPWLSHRSDWGVHGVLDILVDPNLGGASDPDWGECNLDHVYTMCYEGQGRTVSFVISDWYHTGNTMMGDNDRSLTVDIYDLGCVAEWLPPITNADFELQDGSTLPIKFTLCTPGDLSSEISVQITGPNNFDESFTPKYDMETGVYNVIFHTKDYGDLEYGGYIIKVSNAGCLLDSYNFTLDVKAGRGNSGK